MSPGSYFSCWMQKSTGSLRCFFSLFSECYLAARETGSSSSMAKLMTLIQRQLADDLLAIPLEGADGIDQGGCCCATQETIALHQNILYALSKQE